MNKFIFLSIEKLPRCGRAVALFVFSVFLSMPFSQSSSAKYVPGMDCKNTGDAVTNTVCAHPDLKKLDLDLSIAYDEERIKGLHAQDIDFFEAKQKSWMDTTKKKCTSRGAGEGYDLICLRDSYVERIGEISHASFCKRARLAFDIFVCGDEEIKSLKQDLDDIFYKLVRSSPVAMADLLVGVEGDWYYDAPKVICGLEHPRNKEELSRVRGCVADLFQNRQRQLRDVNLTTNNNAPYQLSPLERLIVEDAAKLHEQASSVFITGKPGMEKVLGRMLADIIPHQPDITRAISESFSVSPSVEFTNDRFVFGVGCESGPGCEVQQSAFIIDLITGDAVFALYQIDKSVPVAIHTGAKSEPFKTTIYEKSCASQELKEFARQRLQQSWGSQDVIMPRQAGVRTEILITPCQ